MGSRTLLSSNNPAKNRGKGRQKRPINPTRLASNKITIVLTLHGTQLPPLHHPALQRRPLILGFGIHSGDAV
jgi:hypothetical protein